MPAARRKGYGSWAGISYLIVRFRTGEVLELDRGKALRHWHRSSIAQIIGGDL